MNIINNRHKHGSKKLRALCDDIYGRPLLNKKLILLFQVVLDESVNVTPRFNTFDASKIKIGPLPQAAFVGTPVEFDSKLFLLTLSCSY